MLSNVSVESADYGRTFKADVTNNLGWPIAGIRIAYKVTSEGRSVPWEDDGFALQIDGGIEPGETHTIRTTASVPSEAPELLSTTAQVLDVSDQDQRQLIRDVTIIGWGDQKSDRQCE
jgi:hypothetical protein